MELNGNLKIAVQRSGRLSEGSLELLRNMGLEFETYQNRLFARCRNLPVDILFIRDDDIPEYVQDGVADLGMVGRNVLSECSGNVDVLCQLGYAFCSLCIAVPNTEEITEVSQLNGKRIATSYPNVLRKYLVDNNISADTVLLKGSVEIAPALNIADAICDLVSTGSTLRTNNLAVLDTVMKSQAMLIGNRNIDPEKLPLLEALLLRIQGVQDAQTMKYIMFNVEKDRLEETLSLVPGCDSPTVIPLADSSMAAVHSMVEEEKFWDTVEKIKSVGGSAIIVSPIEKFIR